MTSASPEFEARITGAFGEAGRMWVRALSEHITTAVGRWGLRLGEPFPPSYGWVAPAVRDGGDEVALEEVVLKVAYPGDGWRRQVAVLRWYDGAGMCRLLDADVETGAMLLERLRPGAELATLAARDDDAATLAAAEVMRTLSRPAPADLPLPTVAGRFEGSFGRYRARFAEGGPLPAATFARASALADDLIRSAPAEAVLLHGDLHHHNVLSAERAPWLAIDPKGMLGDPGYEVGPLLRNPRGWPGRHDPRALGRRLDLLAGALEANRERLRAWAIAYAVLSACWAIEDGEDGWDDAVATAEALGRC